jgi:hypothetical protein
MSNVTGGRSKRGDNFRRIGDEERCENGSGSGRSKDGSLETMKTLDDGILVTRDIEMTTSEKLKRESGYPKYLPRGVGDSDEELVR